MEILGSIGRTGPTSRSYVSYFITPVTGYSGFVGVRCLYDGIVVRVVRLLISKILLEVYFFVLSIRSSISAVSWMIEFVASAVAAWSIILIEVCMLVLVSIWFS